MLVTPETKLISGIDNPYLTRTRHYPEYAQRKRAIDIALDRIAENRGYALNGLNASSRRYSDLAEY